MTVLRILKYQLRDHLRSRWALFYSLFFFLLTYALLRFAGSGAQTVLSLLNVVLIVVPLVSLVFGCLYLYNSREFTVLLLSQPIRRSSLFWGLYAGLALSLSAGFVVGVELPLVAFGPGAGENGGSFVLLLFLGVALTAIFLALAFLIALRWEDRVLGVAVALASWLFFVIVYDGLILLALFLFADYPIEKPALAASLLNPVDLARILMLLQFDLAALMGYTAASFQRFFGNALGLPAALFTLFLWWSLPVLLGLRLFRRKDF